MIESVVLRTHTWISEALLIYTESRIDHPEIKPHIDGQFSIRIQGGEEWSLQQVILGPWAASCKGRQVEPTSHCAQAITQHIKDLSVRAKLSDS